MANNNTKAATTYENIWSEYPEPRYWHDLIATPQSRPFYSFTRLYQQPAPPPVVKCQAQIREEQRHRACEDNWREMQLYYLNACGVRRVQEQDVEVLEGVEREEQDTACMSIAAKFREACRSVVGLLVKSKDFVKYDALGTFLVAVVWLYHLVLIAVIIGFLILLMLDLVQRVFGSMDEGESVLEYVLVEKYRSWAIPHRESLPIEAP